MIDMLLDPSWVGVFWVGVHPELVHAPLVEAHVWFCAATDGAAGHFVVNAWRGFACVVLVFGDFGIGHVAVGGPPKGLAGFQPVDFAHFFSLYLVLSPRLDQFRLDWNRVAVRMWIGTFGPMFGFLVMGLLSMPV
jgi:hypothetical protein